MSFWLTRYLLWMKYEMNKFVEIFISTVEARLYSYGIDELLILFYRLTVCCVNLLVKKKDSKNWRF